MDLDGHARLVAGEHLLRWTFGGYDQVRARGPDAEAWVLRPRTTVSVLRAGHRPALHHTTAEVLDTMPVHS